MTRPVLKFLAGFDIVVHESFGQPEHCGVLTANIPKRYCKMATLGKPMPGVKSKVKTDDGSGNAPADTPGNIVGWGRNLFMGYLNRECDTKEAFVDGEEGWVKIGDRGQMDADGFMVGRGRQEDAITLRSGEVILPHKVKKYF